MKNRSDQVIELCNKNKDFVIDKVNYYDIEDYKIDSDSFDILCDKVKKSMDKKMYFGSVLIKNIVAGILYYQSVKIGINLTQSDISNLLNVNPAQIKLNYKRVKTLIEKINKEDFLN